MSTVRILVGTKKGAFILTSDGKRARWDISGPHFAGWEIYHMKGSPVQPDRLFASQCSGWFGQVMQRSEDGGKTWEAVGNDFRYEGVPGTHKWYDGTQHPWDFKRIWHLEPSPDDPDTVYAGAEDAALFKSADGGRTWQELPGLRDAKSELWQPGAGGMGLHTIILDPKHPGRIFVAISAAGVFRTDDGGGNMERDESRIEVPVRAARPGCGSGPLRASHRHAPIASGRALHAEALGRHAHGQRRRVLERSQRQSAVGLRFPHRCPRARAGDRLCRPDQERLGAFPARRQAARLSQPHRRQRMGSADQGAAAKGLLRQRAARRDGRGLARSMRRLFRHHRRPGLCLRGQWRLLDCHRPGPAGGPIRSKRRRCRDSSGAPVSPAHAGGRRGRGAAGSRGAAHDWRGPGRARSTLPGPARDDPRPGYAHAPAVHQVLRLQGGPFPRSAGERIARRGHRMASSRCSLSERWREDDEAAFQNPAADRAIHGRVDREPDSPHFLCFTS